MKLRPIVPEQSTKEFYTSHGGLTFLGQAIALAGLERRLAALGPYRGISHLDILKTYLGLLCQGKSDFEAAEGVRSDSYFQASLAIEQAVSSARLRQRMDESAMDYARAAEGSSLDLLARLGVPVTPLSTGHVPLDRDLFTQDNSGTRKEEVSYTYRGYDGYGVMAAYLGAVPPGILPSGTLRHPWRAEGWCLASDLKPGSENGQLGFGFVLDRVLPAARRLTSRPLLLRLDSGHDALENRVRATEEGIDFIIKWNPRQESAQRWLDHAEARTEGVAWDTPREGKRIATFRIPVTRRWQKREYRHGRVMRVTERTIDRNGQRLLVPRFTLEGWWTSLDLADDQIIALYRDHATSEPFHSEFKTDLDRERLPSGKYETNTLIMSLGLFVYNLLRWVGLTGLIGAHSPVRHDAKRRRARTVMQELICLAGKFYQRGRRLWLRLSRHCPAFDAFSRVNARLIEAGG